MRAFGILGVLLEPATVVAKAWEQVTAVGHRALWEPQTVLVAGAGPIGLLAALIGKQHGLEVHVLDRVQAGLKPELVRQLGATYRCGGDRGPGLPAGRGDRMHRRRTSDFGCVSNIAPGGVVCLTGVGSGAAASERSPTRRRPWSSGTTSLSGA